MEINELLLKRKELYSLIIGYIDDETEDDNGYNEIKLYLDKNEISKSRSDLKELLHLISKISKNHHRYSLFFRKIEKLINYLEVDIKQTFTNSEILDIFKKNKKILLFLITNKYLIIDDEVKNYIITKNRHFFFNEIKSFLDEEKRKEIENELLTMNSNIFADFEQNQQTGENDSYICHLIRNDMIDEFIMHINKTNLNITSKINRSIFETNSFLIDKEPTLIEYAAFFGSIRIFNYLKFNNVPLKPSLWLYAIHSNNAELIHFLEENLEKPYLKHLKESIKCHHNDVAKYIQNNALIENQNDIYSYGFHYYNYDFFPDEINLKNNIFHYACCYDYYSFVELLLKDKELDINEKAIF